MEIRRGIGVSPGYAVERIFILDTERFLIPKRFIHSDDVDSEIARLHEAIDSASQEIRDVQEKFSRAVGDETARIFDAHMWILDDKKIQNEITQRIREEHVTAEYAVSRVFRRYVKLFSEMKEGYLQQRASDIFDNETRLLRHLLGRRRQTLGSLDHKVVIVAHDLTPSQTAFLNPEYVVGIALDLGGATAHSAIMAKALNIPCVMGLKDISNHVFGGDTIALDGARGVVIVSPDEPTQKSYKEKMVRYHEFEKKLATETQDLKSETLDGQAVQLTINIESPAELEDPQSRGYSVGLFRTEFLAMNRETPLSENAHYETYIRCLQHLDGHLLTIRTLDLGGDKTPFFNPERQNEHNPILGCRSIRLSFEEPAIFRAQLKACLRAAVHGPLSIMFPLISSIEELRRAKQFVTDSAHELKEEGVLFDDNVQIGMMIEVPSVALLMDHFVQEVDFFSIGSNDLIQYTLAVDRSNERVAKLYRPAHPALLRLIKSIIEACHRFHKPVSLCGEMAGDVRYTELLLGLGLRNFSMLPTKIPEVKKMVCSLDTNQAIQFSEMIMEMDDAEQIHQTLENRAQQLMPIAF